MMNDKYCSHLARLFGQIAGILTAFSTLTSDFSESLVKLYSLAELCLNGLREESPPILKYNKIILDFFTVLPCKMHKLAILMPRQKKEINSEVVLIKKKMLT